jgi:hypothetical protein
VSYDLVAWPVDRAMTDEEALADIERRAGTWKLGFRRDRRIDAFVKAMHSRFAGIGTDRSPVPMEFNVRSDYVYMTLPWSMVAELVEAIAPLAFDAGLALHDPQREQIALPAPFGTHPLGIERIDEVEHQAAQAIDSIVSRLTSGSGWDPEAGAHAFTAAGGRKIMSPLGFEITPDIQAEVLANPLRVPTSLQTPERKAAAIAQLVDPRADRRHEAAQLLGAWDPDRDVRAALLPLLDSDDVYLVGFAAMGVARQGDASDLVQLLAAVHRMSPADGGTIESMMLPLMAALRLAKIAGPRSVDDVRAKARAWRAGLGHMKPRRAMSDADFDAWLDQMSASDVARDTWLN